MIQREMPVKVNKLTVFVVTSILMAGMLWAVSPDRNTALVTAGLSLLFLTGAFYARDFAEAWLVHLANKHVHLGNYDLVQNTCRRIDSLKPGSFNARMAMGLLHALNEEWQRAERYYREALAVRPLSPEAKYNLGVTCLRLENFKEALNLFNDVINFRPAWGLGYAGKGEAYWELGDYPQAEKNLIISLRLYRSNLGAKKLLEMVQNKMNQSA